jgi:hypothetical protein
MVALAPFHDRGRRLASDPAGLFDLAADRAHASLEFVRSSAGAVTSRRSASPFVVIETPDGPQYEYDDGRLRPGGEHGD